MPERCLRFQTVIGAMKTLSEATFSRFDYFVDQIFHNFRVFGFTGCLKNVFAAGIRRAALKLMIALQNRHEI